MTLQISLISTYAGSSPFCTTWSIFQQPGLEIPGIPKPRKIFSKTMPKVAYWPNKLRWIMVFGKRLDGALHYLYSHRNLQKRLMRFPAVPAFTLTGLCIKILSGQKWEGRPWLFNLYHKAWSPWKNALNAKTSPLTRQLEEERWGKHMALITAAAILVDEPVADSHAENSSTIRGHK